MPTSQDDLKEYYKCIQRIVELARDGGGRDWEFTLTESEAEEQAFEILKQTLALVEPRR